MMTWDLVGSWAEAFLMMLFESHNLSFPDCSLDFLNASFLSLGSDDPDSELVVGAPEFMPGFGRQGPASWVGFIFFCALILAAQFLILCFTEFCCLCFAEMFSWILDKISLISELRSTRTFPTRPTRPYFDADDEIETREEANHSPRCSRCRWLQTLNGTWLYSALKEYHSYLVQATVSAKEDLSRGASDWSQWLWVGPPGMGFRVDGLWHLKHSGPWLGGIQPAGWQAPAQCDH